LPSRQNEPYAIVTGETNEPPASDGVGENELYPPFLFLLFTLHMKPAMKIEIYKKKKKMTVTAQ
jgi:hypothetical protein